MVKSNCIFDKEDYAQFGKVEGTSDFYLEVVQIETDAEERENALILMSDETAEAFAREILAKLGKE